MLQFIFGHAASGKTYEIVNRVSDCVKNGIQPVVLVPEQFSFEFEKQILRTLGDSGAQRVSVLSFSRLCDEIERTVGGICGKTLSDADKLILMKRAIVNAAPQLKVWKKYIHSTGFAQCMVDTISEFKLNAVDSDDLFSAAEHADGTLALKLLDISQIFSCYNAFVSERFIDPTDRLTKLYNYLEDNRFFEDKTVFIDSFSGFTGQQYKIIDRVFSQCRNVTVSLNGDLFDAGKYGIFSNVKKTERRLRSIASSHGIKILSDIVLPNSRYKTPDLVNLEQLMSSGKYKDNFRSQNIHICRADTVYDEAEFVARNIRETVRTKGLRYSDFVVIARDTDAYASALTAACKRNGISCFMDSRTPLCSTPPAAALLAAVDVARGITTESVLRFHKSGMALLDTDELSILENYAYLWSVEGNDWCREWDMDSRGFVRDSEALHKTPFSCGDINKLRKRAILPLLKFRKNFNGNARNMICSIMSLFDDCHAYDAFSAIYKKYKESGNTTLADATRQSWDIIVGILDSITDCFGDSEITSAEFCDSLCAAISLETIGVTPQLLDEVTFGAADRIRPSRPKYAFIMGANQGVFPRTVTGSGVFCNNERSRLIELGINIPDKTIDGAVDEEFLVYTNACCPSSGLFISYCAVLPDGTSASPSAFVETIAEKFKINVVPEPDAVGKNNLPQTLHSAFSEFCRRLSYDPAGAAVIYDAIKDDGGIKQRVQDVLDSVERPVFSIAPSTARRLFGDHLRMSPSRFDNFNRCRFMFFCRDGLKVSRLQPAEFNAMQRGTIVHYVLQNVINEYGKSVCKLDSDEISAAVDRLINLYLDGISGYRSIETPRLKYLVSTISRSLKYVVGRLALEFSQSDFEPVKCELYIGEGGDIPEIHIPAQDGGELILGGIVDRLDRWNGYIRIIDYKTGHREFRLPDILFGQNMQMLIYLYAVSRDEKYGGMPAGIFYMPSARSRGGTARNRRMNGMMPADEELVRAMDKENSGEFVPHLGKTFSESFIPNAKDFDKIFKFIELELNSAAKNIYRGDMTANPVDGIDSPACKYCDFASICRIEKDEIPAISRCTNSEVLRQIERQVGVDD